MGLYRVVTLAGLRRVALYRVVRPWQGFGESPCTGPAQGWAIYGAAEISVEKCRKKNWFFFSLVFFISSLLSGVLDAILLEVMLSFAGFFIIVSVFFCYWRIKNMFLV